eukprot:scaffold34382_cov69-Phaeocystis_antarctica.AAC.4
MLASQNRCGPSVARVGQPAKGKGPLGQERSERGQMAEAMVGGVEEEYRVAPGCISTRLVGHEYVGPAAPLIRRDEPLRRPAVSYPHVLERVMGTVIAECKVTKAADVRGPVDFCSRSHAPAAV